MRLTFIALFAALVAGCATTATQPDRTIDQVVARISSTHGLWANGRSPVIDLPETVTTQQVLDQVFAHSDPGLAITHYNILQVRSVTIPNSLYGSYTAVAVDTNLGRRVVLLEYEGTPIGWWSKVIDPQPKTEKSGELKNGLLDD